MVMFHSFKQLVITAYFAGACCLSAFGVDTFWAMAWNELALALVGILVEGLMK